MSRENEKQTAMEVVLATLDLETIEMNLFRGNSPQVGWQRVFGGQVIGQALMAAQRTVADERFVHSLHAYISCCPVIPPSRFFTRSIVCATARVSIRAGCWRSSTARRSLE
ncbi:thioesterase family protein [Rhizobium sp. BR 362]